MSAAVDLEAVAVARLRVWLHDPVAFVRDVFGAEPDSWQQRVLELLPVSPRVAMSACKGPGKSTTLAWCAWWILACHVDAQGAALSITADNLKDNLWKELAVWYAKSEFLQRAFDHQATRIVSRERPKTWFLSARSFPQSANDNEQANSLAGLHGETVFILLDEVGDMAPGVVSAAKGIFATKGQSAWLLAAGNPTSHEGALYWITTTDARNWHIVHITGDPDDPLRSPRIDADWAREEIATLGRDNPWVMVNILGLFPPQGAFQLIGANDVTAAMARTASPGDCAGEPWVWGLDPARSDATGADEAALVMRKGIMAMPVKVWRGLDGPALAEQVIQLVLEAQKRGEGPAKIFVDVGGVGTSCYDHLVHLGWGHLVVGVDFGGAARDSRYFDKRTEMWVDAAEWVKERPSCLPQDPVLRAELQAPRHEWRRVNKRTCFKLESKDDMRKRGVRSPNRADALVLTFAHPVVAETAHTALYAGQATTAASSGYDPLGRS